MRVPLESTNLGMRDEQKMITIGRELRLTYEILELDGDAACAGTSRRGDLRAVLQLSGPEFRLPKQSSYKEATR